ncbi:hypothetical protein FSP39_011923 [Pinctada imbricata]|uniref:Receptor ligand binding region domain-containing protein n=1 Tax=Pinctada imbricata TaxID=66713 RepID=A0AA88YTE7_PINIB|nr:hypothetical protein FSP39_011923 [Pinctada imbricata]
MHEDVKNAFIWTFGKLNLQSKRELLMAPNPHVMDLKDSFRVSKRVCMEIEAGAKIIFGPSSTTSSSQVQAITNVLGIPHIQFHQDADDVTASISGPTLLPGKHHMTLNLFPSNRKMNQAHRDLVEILEWTSYTVIYDSFDGLIRLQDVLLSTVREDVEVIIRELDKDPKQYGKMFKAMKDSAEYKLIIDCDVSKIETFLSKDLSLVNLDTFRATGANITAFSIVSKDNPLVMRLLGEWKYELFKTESNLSPLSKNKNFVSTEVALMYDAVQVFDRALGNLRKAINVDFDRKLHCNRTDTTWDDGTSLLNYMKTIEFPGMTGKVHFGDFGLRDHFDLDILKLGQEGLEKIGVWTSIGLSAKQRINITKTHVEPVILLANRRLRVVTKTVWRPSSLFACKTQHTFYKVK